ncbi:MAG TPA: hypothetical protein VIG33_09635 [Pseudobdellovibrionaceae bacterium]
MIAKDKLLLLRIINARGAKETSLLILNVSFHSISYIPGLITSLAYTEEMLKFHEEFSTGSIDEK